MASLSQGKMMDLMLQCLGASSDEARSMEARTYLSDMLRNLCLAVIALGHSEEEKIRRPVQHVEAGCPTCQLLFGKVAVAMHELVGEKDPAMLGQLAAMVQGVPQTTQEQTVQSTPTQLVQFVQGWLNSLLAKALFEARGNGLSYRELLDKCMAEFPELEHQFLAQAFKASMDELVSAEHIMFDTSDQRWFMTSIGRRYRYSIGSLLAQTG